MHVLKNVAYTRFRFQPTAQGSAREFEEFSPSRLFVRPMDGERRIPRIWEASRVSISTEYGDTPWRTAELARLHGVVGSRAHGLQQKLDKFIVEVWAPVFVARRTRPDQAAVSMLATMHRWAYLHAADPERTKAHLTRLIRVAYDRAAARRMEAASKRLPSASAPAPAPQVKQINSAGAERRTAS